MSAEEMREFCNRIRSFQLRVHVRLKNASEILVGRIAEVEDDRFLLQTEDEVQTLRYAWVAGIKNA
jgi:hypothetical protein